MKNKITILPLMFIFFLPLFGFGYFEYRYYCNVNTDKIIVSQTNKHNGSKCFELINKINTQILGINQNIDSMQVFIDKNEDIEFRSSLQNELKNKVIGLELSINKIISAMSLFEKDLFNKVKKILDYHFEKKIISIDKNIENYNVILKKTIKDGNIDDFKLFRNKIEVYLIEKMLILKMKDSKEFSHLIPIMNFWYQEYFKKTFKSL